MNSEVIGAIITNMSELIKDDSSSEGGLMSGLQERTREDFPPDDGTDACDDFGIYEDGEPWGYKYKALLLKQTIGRKPWGNFANKIPTLYAYSWHGYSKVCETSMTDTKEWAFYQAKE